MGVQNVHVRPVKVVPGWRHSWRWLSVQANVAAQCVLAGWVFLRDQPLPQWVMVLVWAILAVGFVGRFVKQKGAE